MGKYELLIGCGLYEIKDDGTIIILKTGKTAKLLLNKKGYLVLSRFRKSFTGHRLVASKFIPNPKNLPEINHKDGDKTNNHRDNLEWCTAKENKKHAMDNGLFKIFKGDSNGNSKLESKEVKKIKELLENKTMLNKDIAKLFNISPSTISAIKHKKLRKDE